MAPDLRRHAPVARRIEHLHRLFQVSLGIVGGQHPDVVEACGRPVAWTGTYGKGEGGVCWSGPRGKHFVVPTLDGAWAPGNASVQVVGAADEVVDVLFHSAGQSIEGTSFGREGNQLARQWFYLQRGIPEPEFVHQYLALAHGAVRPRALTGLFPDVTD